MPNKTVKVRYIKAHDFKTVLSTGVYGGVSANGLIDINFYVDRTVIPKSETFEFNEANKSITPISIEKDGDAIREVQVGVLLDTSMAKILIEWLQGKIKQAEHVNSQANKK